MYLVSIFRMTFSILTVQFLSTNTFSRIAHSYGKIYTYTREISNIVLNLNLYHTELGCNDTNALSHNTIKPV